MTKQQRAIIRAIKFAVKDSKEQFAKAKRAKMYSEMATCHAYENGLWVALEIAKGAKA